MRPRIEVVYKSLIIEYFQCWGRDQKSGSSDGIELVNSLSDLPDVYGNIQVCYGPNGKVIAYCWIGESRTIQTVGGAIKGSNISIVDESILFHR